MADPHKFLGRSGQTVGGRYELMEVIGSGGQSVVYRARDQIDGDEVALKICEWSDPDASERMFREALVMAQLQNTSAVRVLHQCQTEDGAMALVMELLEGSDLSTVLELREAKEIKADRAWITSILEPIVSTLEAAHDRGFVHRDVKAENVFVLDPRSVHPRESPVRLLDFGFAKLTRSPLITAPEVFAGSPSYIAPEIWRDGVWRADARVDVYALGVLIFRILGGRMPFEGSAVQIARGALTSARPSLHVLRPDLPDDLDSWVFQVLAIEPENRFAKITAAWRAFEACF